MANVIGNVPQLHARRSSWKMPEKLVTSWKHGELVPINVIEVVPGDTFKLNLSSVIRMNTPIAPFFGDIECEINSFFVPMRLVWEHTEEFFGANKTQAGAQTNTYTIPSNSIFGYAGITDFSIGAYMGLPLASTDYSKTAFGRFNVLPIRAYCKIWSDFYRASMIQNPLVVQLSDTNDNLIASDGINMIYPGSSLLKVNKALGIFTLALQSPQYGSNGVTLPLGTTAPIALSIPSVSSAAPGDTLTIASDSKHIDASGDVVNVYADLSAATAATINQLRYAFATQKYLEAMNYGGSQYWSILNAVYGVTPADNALQRPQRLGTINFTLNMSQVTAMADTTIEGSVKPAGSVGAISVTGMRKHLYTKAFDEPGYVITLLHTRVKNQVYSQGISKEFTHLKRLDLYNPFFAEIGDVEVKKSELFVNGTSSDNVTFGYQEAWYEYRYRFDRATGILNPNATGAVDIWSLTNKFVSHPLLDSSFLQEDRNLVASRLTTGTASKYDYIGEFLFDYTVIRPMPVSSNPAALDHYIK